MSRRVLLLELNELCPPLLARFMAQGDLPGFSRLHEESLVYVTDAEEPQEHLNPWVQWVTAHSGVGYAEHGVFKLGEGDRLDLPTVADAVGRAGRRVWLCGPMNVVPTDAVRGSWLPDPWNPRDAPVPRELEAFADFVRANVQEHTNVSHRMSWRSYAPFVAFMARHGLSASTVMATARQLVGERLGRRERWRRAALLDRFQWDLFSHMYRRERPDFATYFSNTTAHYQHVYWRYMDPDPFTIKPDAAEQARFGEAIRFGYQEMDRLVSAALALADDDTTVVFCTAISQQPYLLKEGEGGSRFYRPTDMADLVHRLGLTGVRDVSPVMASEFHVFFSSERDAAAAAEALAAATIDGRAIFSVRTVGDDVLVGCAVVHDLPAEVTLRIPATGVELPFHEHFYRAETPKSGYHHPEGALWIRTPDRRGMQVEDRVPLRSVAPTLLRLLSVDPPESMRAPTLALERSELLAG